LVGHGLQYLFKYNATKQKMFYCKSNKETLTSITDKRRNSTQLNKQSITQREDFVSIDHPYIVVNKVNKMIKITLSMKNGRHQSQICTHYKGFITRVSKDKS